MEFESNQPVNENEFDRDNEQPKAVARSGNQSRRLLITAAIATPAIIASSAQTARATNGSASATSTGS
ncbi:hypothetical protein CKO51_25760 [Rhodopirellula sp. SM50]|nr:hypothetical protein [Rhodopirellula sp. SM50]PAY16585.1 hypothetical protein CKO51_25760 [Rhodopirellula sp. SM50]